MKRFIKCQWQKTNNQKYLTVNKQYLKSFNKMTNINIGKAEKISVLNLPDNTVFYYDYQVNSFYIKNSSSDLSICAFYNLQHYAV